MIETKEALNAWLAPLRSQAQPITAVDTEADSLYRYSERLCLVQISDGNRHELIDSLAIDDLSILGEFLKTSHTWMHGADYDMTMLLRSMDVCPPVVYDTQVGARLLGVQRFGYGNLVEDYLGVTLEKSSQKANWGKRPLTPKMSEYALNDVVYLFPLAEKIVSDLKEKGRYDWFLESCEAARDKVLNRTAIENPEPWRINGSGKLNSRGLCYLRTLWYWRDKEAAEWDKPTYMVLTNKEMIRWCDTLANGGSISTPDRYRSQRRKRLKDALSQAKGEPQDQWPVRPRGKRRRLDEEFETRVAGLQKIRDTRARELEIDPSLIIARATMEALCVPDTEVQPDDLLLNWQRNILGL